MTDRNLTARILDTFSNRDGKTKWCVSQTITAPNQGSLQEQIKEACKLYTPQVEVVHLGDMSSAFVPTLRCPLCNAPVNPNGSNMLRCPSCSGNGNHADKEFGLHTAIKSHIFNVQPVPLRQAA